MASEADTAHGALPFAYRPLKDDTYIRIFRIIEAPADDSSGIPAVTLMDTPLEEAPPYSTLSYCWGDSTKSRSVLCNGRTLYVTDYLHSIISSIRSCVCDVLETSRVWWVDQICINQADDREKTQQVGLMSKIFSESSLTLAWLGPGVTRVDPALKKFWRYVQEVTKTYAEKASQDGRPPDIDSLDLFDYRSDRWEPLTSMLRQPWFERIWVIQEVAFGHKNLWFYYGGLLISQDLLSSIFVYTMLHTEMRRNIAFQFGSLKAAYLFKARDWAWHRDASRGTTQAQNEDVVWPLVTLLAVSENAKATDPRDHIYALYSFLSQKDEMVRENLPNLGKADYTCDTYTVYRDVTKFCIEERRDLWIISYKGQIADEEEFCRSAHQNLPSWAIRPDLPPSVRRIDTDRVLGLSKEDPTDMRVQILPKETFSASDHHPLEVRSDADPDVLSVKGVHIERVRECACRLESDDLFFYNQPGTESPSFFRQHPVVKMWQDCSGWLGFDPTRTDDDEMDEFAVAFLEVFNAFHSTSGAASGKIELAVHTADTMQAFWRLLSRACRAQHDQIPVPEEAIAIYERRAPKEEAHVVTGHPEDRLIYGDLYFVTESGKLGIGPPKTRPGDEIFVLYGEIYPHVLRRCGDEYHHLGEAFVRDYCDGRAVREADAGLRETIWIDIR